MKTGTKGIELIKDFEGFRGRPYLCSASVATIGYGTTRYPNGRRVALEDLAVTEAQSVAFLQKDLESREREVVKMLGKTAVSQNQFDALISFAYNLGTAALERSTLLKKVVANPSDPTIENEFLKWTMAGGKRLEGLLRRRKAEWALFRS